MQRDASLQGDPGIEPEETNGDRPAKNRAPFDATDLRIDGKPLAIDQLIARLAKDGIDLYPDFQPKAGLWSAVDQSRLIESLLIRVPLPAFYFDASDDRKWLVIDGLQRLTTLKSFVVDKKLKLKGMEFLEDLNGKKFGALPRHHQRRILETQVTAFLIREGCPPEVKHNIFRRINTGGTPLAGQEIRHALNQGQATRFLKLLAGSKDFKAATGGGVASQHLADQECVLRFLAFHMTPYGDYRTGDLDRFLADHMHRLNGVDGKALKQLRADFQRALGAAGAIFGDHAFRKRLDPEAAPGPVNKGLFEAWTVALAKLEAPELEKLVGQKDALNKEFIKLMSNSVSFVDSISYATGDPKKVKIRFGEIEKLIQEILECSPN
jgi:hypothetical protein